MVISRTCLALSLLLALSVTAIAAQRRPPTSFPILAADAEDERLEEKLAARVAISCPEKTLFEFVEEELRQKQEIDVWIDRRALDDVGLGLDTPVAAAEFRSVRLETGLETLLGALDLTFIVRGSLLVITTPEEAELHLVTRVYPVEDLVKCDGPPINAMGMGMMPTGFIAGVGSMEFPQTVPKKVPESWSHDYDTLIEMITSTVRPDSWDEVGGAGTIEAFPNGVVLVISQTRQVHRKIEALFVTLRKVKGNPTADPSKRLQDLKTRFQSRQ